MRIDKQNFEYFFSAMLYCLWLREVKIDKFLRINVDRCMIFILKYLFLRRIRKKCFKNRRQSKIIVDNLNGFMNIETAKNWLVFAYQCYPGFISLVLMGWLMKLFPNINFLLILIVLLIPIEIFYSMLNNLIFKHDNYLNYFKQFENEDEKWLKKWRRITITFCIGSIAMIVLGVVVASMINGMI